MTAEKPRTAIKQKDILPVLPRARAEIQYKIETFVDCEKDYFNRLMYAAKGNINEAIRLSGLARSTIYYKIARYKIKRPM